MTDDGCRSSKCFESTSKLYEFWWIENAKKMYYSKLQNSEKALHVEQKVKTPNWNEFLKLFPTFPPPPPLLQTANQVDAPGEEGSYRLPDRTPTRARNVRTKVWRARSRYQRKLLPSNVSQRSATPPTQKEKYQNHFSSLLSLINVFGRDSLRHRRPLMENTINEVVKKGKVFRSIFFPPSPERHSG